MPAVNAVARTWAAAGSISVSRSTALRVVAFVVIVVSFFTAKRRGGIVVPLGGWALLIADVAIMAVTVAQLAAAELVEAARSRRPLRALLRPAAGHGDRLRGPGAAATRGRRRGPGGPADGPVRGPCAGSSVCSRASSRRWRSARTAASTSCGGAPGGGGGAMRETTSPAIRYAICVAQLAIELCCPGKKLARDLGLAGGQPGQLQRRRPPCQLMAASPAAAPAGGRVH